MTRGALGTWLSGMPACLVDDIPRLVYHRIVEYSVFVLKPAEEFLASLEAKLAAKAFREIELLAAFGPRLPFPHARKIKGTEKLHELLVKQSSNICRLFYFFKADRIYVITSGYIKKSDRTEPEQIQRALRLMEAYQEDSDEQR